ncbi:hypothetical protein [Acinetobacter ihumii]|nr:hypothetical protein [Acinetobacter ihumii]
MHYILGTLRIIAVLIVAMMILLALTEWDQFFAPQHLSSHPESFLQ